MANGAGCARDGLWQRPNRVGWRHLRRNFRVKAKNASGALVWADMMCHATYDGTYWTVVDLKQD